MAQNEMTERTIMDSNELENCFQRMAYEILEEYPEEPVAFVGIYTRGVPFSDRLFEIVSEKNPNVRRGTLDITLYRDDLDNLGTIPSVKSSNLPFEVEGSRILLLDDVLFTGRTVRAALDVLMDYGRPDRIELGTLIDRGHREVPICPDFTGKTLDTTLDDYVNVRFTETDDRDGVYLVSDPGEDQS